MLTSVATAPDIREALPVPPKPPRQGLPWTEDEIARAVRMRLDGVSPADIAEALGRTRATVYTQLRKHDCVVQKHRKWTDTELARLRALLEGGATDAQAADALGRDATSVRHGRERVGMIVPWSVRAARTPKPAVDPDLPLWKRRRIRFGPPAPPKAKPPVWDEAAVAALRAAAVADDARAALEGLAESRGISLPTLKRRAKAYGVPWPVAPPPAPTGPTDDEVRAAWVRHGSVKGVREELGMGRHATAVRLEELGLRTKRPRGAITPDVVAQVRRLAPTKTVTGIADAVGRSARTVRALVAREGIETLAPERKPRAAAKAKAPRPPRKAADWKAPAVRPDRKDGAARAPATPPAREAPPRERIVRTPHVRPKRPVPERPPVAAAPPPKAPRALSPAEVFAALKARRAKADG